MNNQFVQSAMAAPSIDQYMNQAQDLDTLLTSLGLAPTAEPIADGFRTPANVLDTLGMDQQVVQTELEILKSYLETDGLNPYMVRSAALERTAT